MRYIMRVGEYTVQFMACAFLDGDKAEIFLHIQNCRRKHLQFRLEELGAKQVCIHSFPLNDRSKLASKFFGRVLQKAFSSSDGARLIVRGSTMLLPMFMNVEGQDEEGHAAYDIVKKRQAMDSSASVTDESQEALDAFEDFESIVLPALGLISIEDNNNRRSDLEEFEANLLSGIVPSTTGGVYFAWSECLRCMKIGATRGPDPTARLYQLSHHVTVPFILVGWIPTPAPFRQESLAHARFASKRIRHAGAGTEFFKIDSAAAVAYCTKANEFAASLK